ncbi:TPA: hypothetical protein EYP38_02115, partial [Candidatus Micrarchaeota archaeon]|nr:hypothetical protein [Candidatus Micrarchaeota archaeon]
MAKAQKKPGLPGKTDSQPKEAPRPNKPPDNAATVQIGPGSRVVGGLPGVVVEDAVDIFKTVI